MNLDKTFCMSPNCKNNCGRQLTDEIREQAKKIGKYLSVACFCGPLPKVELDVEKFRRV